MVKIDGDEKQLELFKQDPAYAAIFKDPPDVSEFIKNIKDKIQVLREDWDKPETVFGQNLAIEKPGKELEA